MKHLTWLSITSILLAAAVASAQLPATQPTTRPAPSTQPNGTQGIIRADGGIILTASHNPKEWNALKLLNSAGEFISAEFGSKVLEKAAREDFIFASVEKLGTIIPNETYLQKHVDAVVNYPLVNAKAIAKRNFKIVVDPINSTGAIFVPALLRALGVNDIILLNKEVNGQFAHHPEPLPENLSTLSKEVVKLNADLGIAVDPDVDRQDQSVYEGY